ncbi:MAG: coenzyme F420-0:L-glutamate ligase [Nitrososphaerota archaeon]|nr:coenzyme F420-0:L-glutamate ligase [Nitrososphaerota archaeon]MDG6903228.1 coenzyme F420-0:L-glutamate ligase [Nitrososphaerota archaeon]MDG6910699.1 coenzyme F420-0:L-glutamate ligase [Nitrososphaerota archaeon]MDG6911706.1 coenzyme F420-0:L-glutamate ligase [Nitrososphaerota archaeon]MDG6940608.1 coenzyme F420-0:L-glutamate ligase [Nitrososphaerota archaeon]
MLTLRPVRVPAKGAKFDLVALIEHKVGAGLRDGDVLVISSKFVAMSEGRVVRLQSVKAGARAKTLAAEHHMDPRLCELVLRESDRVIGGIPGFLLASREGLLTPNAGIDKSNVKHGAVILYPRRADVAAQMIREALMFSRGVSVGVVICDSRLSPTRKGTTGVAIGASGIEAVQDMRGMRDLFGNVLKVTAQAVADDLSSAAEVLMGESDESTPIVLVRGLKKALQKGSEYGPRRFAVRMEEDVYLRSLGFTGRAYA